VHPATLPASNLAHFVGVVNGNVLTVLGATLHHIDARVFEFTACNSLKCALENHFRATKGQSTDADWFGIGEHFGAQQSVHVVDKVSKVVLLDGVIHGWGHVEGRVHGRVY
jgi:hypothetical protein